MSYLTYLTPAESITVRLGGREITAQRARLGKHLLLLSLWQKYEEEVGGGDAAAIHQALVRYVATALDCDIGQATLVELAEAATRLRVVNTFREQPSYMAPYDTRPTDHELPYEYSDRWATLWVHNLAAAYHWSKEHILNLWPEEAAYYYQEILIDRWYDHEWEYNIHGVGNTKHGWRAMRKLPWMVGRPKPTRILKRMLPVGNVVRMGAETQGE